MPAEIRAFAPPTIEMRLWQRVLGSILRPPARLLGLPGSALRFLLVTPLAHLSWLSARYQLYLLLLFHQRRLSWLGHSLGFPITILALCAVVAPHHLGPPPTSLGAALVAPGGTLLGLLALTAYHLYLAVFFRSLALGAIMVALGGVFYVAGIACAFWLGNLDASPRAPWVPWGVAVASAALVTLSHLAERDVPPAVTGTGRWVALKTFLDPTLGPRRFGINVLRSTGAFFGGVLSELWGAPRLLALVIVHRLGRLGLRRGERAQLEAWVQEALRSGNPALHFIGVGGAAPLPTPAEDREKGVRAPSGALRALAVEDLLGSWSLVATSNPQYRGREQVTFTYREHPADAAGAARFLDEVRFTVRGRSSAYRGLSTQDSALPGHYIWRGRGWLRPFRADVFVVALDRERGWAALYYPRGLTFPATLHVLSRAPGSWDRVQAWLEPAIAQDPLLAQHRPRLFVLP